MSNAFVIYVVAAVTLAVPLSGQTAKPDFAGVWMITNVPAAAAASGGAAALPPTPMTIRQTATSLAIDRTAFGKVTTMTFTIGADKDDTNRTGAQVWTTRTKWDGKALVTTGSIVQHTTAGVDEWDITERWTMDARGHIIVERKQVDQNGKVTANRQDYAPHKVALESEARP